MPQDAFTLRHIARELNEQLRGGKVNKIIQPSRDEIDILLYAGGKTKKLVLNTNASFARAILSDIPRTAPDVAPNFCMLLRKYITGAQLLSVAQCGFERILAFTFDCCGEFSRATRILYAEIMGKYSNLILTENGIIAGALKISSLQENFKRALFPGVRYLPPEPQDKSDPSDEARLCERLSAFQGGDFAEFLFGNLSGLALPTCRILADKLGNPDRPFGENVAKTAQRIREFLFSDEVSPAVERVNGEARDFHARYNGEAYPTVCAAADAYYTERETKRDFNEKKRKLESLLQARRKKEEKKLALLRERENSCADMEKTEFSVNLSRQTCMRSAKERKVAKSSIITTKMRRPSALRWIKRLRLRRTHRNIIKNTTSKSARLRRSRRRKRKRNPTSITPKVCFPLYPARKIRWI